MMWRFPGQHIGYYILHSFDISDCEIQLSDHSYPSLYKGFWQIGCYVIELIDQYSDIRFQDEGYPKDIAFQFIQCYQYCLYLLFELIVLVFSLVLYITIESD